MFGIACYHTFLPHPLSTARVYFDRHFVLFTLLEAILFYIHFRSRYTGNITYKSGTSGYHCYHPLRTADFISYNVRELGIRSHFGDCSASTYPERDEATITLKPGRSARYLGEAGVGPDAAPRDFSTGALLVTGISRGWDGSTPRSGVRTSEL